jgi:hypothetical protein
LQSKLQEFDVLHQPSLDFHHTTLSMSHIYDSTSRYRPRVHWHDESIRPSQEENQFTNIKKRGQRISVNASLPFHSKLNIRIHANRINRNDLNETNQVKATATIQRLDPRYEHEHIENLQRAYSQHYSTLSSNENIRRNSPIQYYTLPVHRQISLPISLPINQRLFLYIRNGEIFARI